MGVQVPLPAPIIMIQIRPPPKLPYFSPFECGMKLSGWRWYHKFVTDHPDMILRIESDMFDCLIKHGLVTC